MSIESKPIPLTRRIVDLFKQEKVNPWSFHKPIGAPTYATLTTQDFYRYNDGFTVNVQPNGPDCYDTAISATGGWSYLVPQGGPLQPQRMLDLDGYDSEAEPWFSPEFIGASTIETGGASVRVVFPGGPSETGGDNVIKWIVEHFNLFSGDLEFGFILKVGSVFYYKKVGDVIDVLDDADNKMKFSVPLDAQISLPASGYIVPVLRSLTSLDAGYFGQVSRNVTGESWFPLPCTPFAITIVQGGTSDLNHIYIYQDGVTHTHTIKGSTVTIKNLVIPFKSDADKRIYVKVKITLYNDPSVVFYDSQFGVPAGGTYNLSITSKTYTAALTASCILNVNISLTDGSAERDDRITLWNDKE